MTQVCSFPSSTADVNDMYNNKRLPKGIHIVGTDRESVSKVGGMSKNEEGFDKNNHKESAEDEADSSEQQDAALSSEKKKKEAENNQKVNPSEMSDEEFLELFRKKSN